jgi:hypothetical protein
MTTLSINAWPQSLVAGEALSAGRLVKLSGATAIYTDASEKPVFVVLEDTRSGDLVPVDVIGSRIHVVVGDDVISAGTNIYCTTDGKVSASAVGSQIGVTLTRCAGNGQTCQAALIGPSF